MVIAKSIIMLIFVIQRHKTMKNLLIILTILISSVGYSQSSDALTSSTPSNVNVDSVIYYFIELVNEEKFRIGPVFDGVIEEVYEKKFYQKNGKWVNDTARMSYATPQKLVIDSGLTLGAEHQAEYLRLYNNKHEGELYISHYQKDTIEGFKNLYTWIDRSEYFKTESFTEILTAGTIVNQHPNINKEIAESAYSSYHNSKGHRKKMLGVKYSKTGVSIKLITKGYYMKYIFVCTLS